jgi:hypothetical protein
VFALSAARFDLQMLSLRLPRPWPVFLVTVKNRTLSPQAALFLGVLRKHVPPQFKSVAPLGISPPLASGR